MSDNSVALAAITIMGTCVGCMVWVVKKVLTDVAPALNNHTKAATSLKTAVESNTQSNVQMIEFMKRLNGKLPKLVEEKKRERMVADKK